MYNGFINVLKPTGMTSNDVVGKLKYLARKHLGEKLKFGHTGTLDPNAAGVMMVCCGRATKFSQYAVEKKKTYIAEITFGKTTDTMDTYGQITEERESAVLLPERIEEVLSAYRGETMQIPPKYSAIKINGQKLYDLARKGADIPEIKPRRIEITKLETISYSHPCLKIEVECSAGTYIRSLAQDIGEDLGELSHLSLLIRTKVEDFAIEDSFSIEEIEELISQGRFSEVLTGTEKILSRYPEAVIKNRSQKAYMNGVIITQEGMLAQIKKDMPDSRYKVYNENGEFLGIGNIWKNQNSDYVLKSETQI